MVLILILRAIIVIVLLLARELCLPKLVPLCAIVWSMLQNEFDDIGAITYPVLLALDSGADWNRGNYP